MIRQAGRTVAVLACDPQSPLTGGALLGDRIRMPNRPDDDAVFIRSLATPSGHSGVAPNLDLMIGLFGRFGFETVIVETVGAGQGDTAVRDVADVVVVLVQPETGDELQWEKAGQLEIADIVVVHKADLPSADRTSSRSSASCSTCPAAGRCRSCASARAKESAWKNSGRPSRLLRPATRRGNRHAHGSCDLSRRPPRAGTVELHSAGVQPGLGPVARAGRGRPRGKSRRSTGKTRPAPTGR